jgi:hypothetical protein
MTAKKLLRVGDMVITQFTMQSLSVVNVCKSKVTGRHYIELDSGHYFVAGRDQVAPSQIRRAFRDGKQIYPEVEE